MKQAKRNIILSKELNPIVEEVFEENNNSSSRHHKSNALFDKELKVYKHNYKRDLSVDKVNKGNRRGKIKETNTNNTNTNVVRENVSVDKLYTDYSNMYSSSSNYWDNRNERNKERIAKIRKEQEMKELNEIRAIPRISKRSREIAKKLKEGNACRNYNDNNQHFAVPVPIPIPNSQSSLKQKPIKKNTCQVKNSKGHSKGNDMKLSTTDTLYLNKRLNMIQQEEIKRMQIQDKENENNNNIKSLLENPTESPTCADEGNIHNNNYSNKEVNCTKQQNFFDGY